MRYERQCTKCGMIFDVEYPADPETFKCHYCKPGSKFEPNHATKSLKRVKRKTYVSDYIQKREERRENK